MLQRFLDAWDDTCKNLPTSTAKIAYLVGYNRAMLNCYLDGIITYDEVQKMSRRIDAMIVAIMED